MKKLALWIVGVLYFGLGILKWNYILNFGLAQGPFLMSRYSALAQQNYNSSFSDPVRYFLLTPKWISAIVYGNLFLGLNLVIIYLIYSEKVYLQFTFWLFFLISFLSILTLGVAFLTDSFSFVYPIVSRIKELQQSPFTLLLLLAAFQLTKRPN